MSAEPNFSRSSSPPRSTFQEQVLAELGQDLCAGRYRPGQVIPSEAELCGRFSFSRIVIREAIKSLAAKGMLDVRRKVGTVVRDPVHWHLFDPDIIAWRAQTASPNAVLCRDLMELRRIVEPSAARFAALRASESERRALRAAYRAMEQAIEGGGDYVAADLAFHSIVLAACGNQFVRQMQNALSSMLRTSFAIISLRPGGPAFSLPMHDALCAAIEAGEPDAAERAAVVLIEQAAKDLNERLQGEEEQLHLPDEEHA